MSCSLNCFKRVEKPQYSSYNKANMAIVLPSVGRWSAEVPAHIDIHFFAISIQFNLPEELGNKLFLVNLLHHTQPSIMQSCPNLNIKGKHLNAVSNP